MRPGFGGSPSPSTSGHPPIPSLRSPDGHSPVELSRFPAPAPIADHLGGPLKALGHLRVMFAVMDLHATFGR